METNPPPLFINLSNIHANNSLQVKLPSPVVPSNNSDERSPLARSFSSAVKGLISQKNKLAGVSSFAGRFVNAQRNRAATSNGGSGPEYGLSVQERLNRILLSNERSDEDAQLLYKMIKSNAFFEKFLEMNDNLEAQSLIEVCKRIKYEKHFAHTAICKQGDPSNGKLYIVFSGELSVYIKNPDLITTQNITLEEKEKKALAEKEKEANTNSPSNRKRPSFRPPPVETVGTPRKLNTQASVPVEKEVTSATLLKEKERRSVFAPKNPKIAKGLAKLAVISKVISQTVHLKKEKEKKEKDDLSENYGVAVDNIVKGGFFGERALITNLPRAATIYANTDCELLVLTKDVFMSLKSRFDKKKNRIVDFILKSIPCVDQLSSGTMVEKFYYLFKEQTYEYGNTIINEGAKGEHIFLVFEGACEIVKNVKIDQSHTFKSSMSQVSPLLALGKTSFQQVMLHTIPQGTFFGEELMFEKSETYRYTVKVASPKAVVFAIQKSKFKMRFPRNTYWDMKDVYLQKLASHEKRLTDYILNKYPSQGAVIKQEEIKKMLGYNSDNGKDNDPQSKYVVVAKEPGPYYNVFKNGRPRTSYKAEMISSEQALRDDLLLSLNIPKEDGELTSLVAKRRLVATSRSQRSYTESSHSATRVEVEESGIMTARERIESDMIKGSEGLDAVKHVSAKQCSNTRSYGIRDPTLQFRNEYFEKINVIMPSLMVNAENSKREDVINNVNSFKVDMGKAEASLEKRYRIRMMQSSRSKEGSSHSYDNSKNVKTVRNIQTSLMSRKKRFEKKSQKLQDSFKNLVHTRSSSSEESVKAVTSATVSLNRDITSSRSTLPPRHISLVDNEYALQPQVQSARSEKKAFTICPSKYATMSQSQTTQTRWRSKTDASKESSCQLEISQATQQTQQHQSEEEKEASLVTQSSYKKASKKASPEDKISKILKTVQEISNSPGGMYFNREKEMEFKDYGFGDALM